MTKIFWDEPSLRPPLTWREELRQFLDETRVRYSFFERDRNQYAQVLQRTLAEEVYPAFEELLDEFTKSGIGGEIYGRDTGYAVSLRLDEGFEVAIERERYREQSHLLPRLIFIQYIEQGGRRYCVTNGISCDFIKKPEVIRRILDEYRHWKIVRGISPQ